MPATGMEGSGQAELLPKNKLQPEMRWAGRRAAALSKAHEEEQESGRGGGRKSHQIHAGAGRVKKKGAGSKYKKRARIRGQERQGATAFATSRGVRSVEFEATPRPEFSSPPSLSFFNVCVLQGHPARLIL